MNHSQIIASLESEHCPGCAKGKKVAGSQSFCRRCTAKLPGDVRAGREVKGPAYDEWFGKALGILRKKRRVRRSA